MPLRDILVPIHFDSTSTNDNFSLPIFTNDKQTTRFARPVNKSTQVSSGPETGVVVCFDELYRAAFLKSFDNDRHPLMIPIISACSLPTSSPRQHANRLHA